MLIVGETLHAILCYSTGTVPRIICGDAAQHLRVQLASTCRLFLGEEARFWVLLKQHVFILIYLTNKTVKWLPFAF